MKKHPVVLGYIRSVVRFRYGSPCTRYLSQEISKETKKPPHFSRLAVFSAKATE